MQPAQLTEANLKKIGGPNQAEHEEQLLDRAQTLSNLLAKVNMALDDCPSTTVPSTAGSRRAPPTGQRPPTVERAATGQRTPLAAPPAADDALAGGKHEPQVISLSELNAEAEPVQLVNYTGSQSQIAGISSRRKVAAARATKSEMGSLLSWGGDDHLGYYLQRR